MIEASFLLLPVHLRKSEEENNLLSWVLPSGIENRSMGVEKTREQEERGQGRKKKKNNGICIVERTEENLWGRSKNSRRGRNGEWSQAYSRKAS